MIILTHFQVIIKFFVEDIIQLYGILQLLLITSCGFHILLQNIPKYTNVFLLIFNKCLRNTYHVQEKKIKKCGHENASSIECSIESIGTIFLSWREERMPRTWIQSEQEPNMGPRHLKSACEVSMLLCTKIRRHMVKGCSRSQLTTVGNSCLLQEVGKHKANIRFSEQVFITCLPCVRHHDKNCSV